VCYLGYRFDINAVLRDVHVVVLPSYREGMPFSLIEGLASKKFIIASDVPGCRDVVIDNYNGFLVRPQSCYDLCLKMEKYLKCDNKEELHNNALASASKFDQKKIIPELIDLIREII
ncbi:MAG: glycosyltransferase, partial [Bacilli bacterium]|nr:glycosyltransferase [Bacilli bacterium]